VRCSVVAVIVVLLHVVVGVEEDVSHVFVDEPVHGASAILGAFHQVGIPEGAEVVGSERLRDVQQLGELCDVGGPLGESMNDGGSSGMGQGTKQRDHAVRVVEYPVAHKQKFI